MVFPRGIYKFAGLSLAAATLGAGHSYGQDGGYAEDEIVVTGARIHQGSIDDAITGVSVLSGDALADRLAPTIGETLKSEPGVSSSFFGAGASRPIIRGQGGDRVRVLTNGIGSIDASSASPDHAVAAEPAQAESIEVLRGASLLRFGSSGSGGVVNIIDGRIPHDVPETTEIAIRIGASSVDLGREVAGALDKAISDHLVVHLDGSWREADNYRIPSFAESDVLHAAEEAEEGGAIARDGKPSGALDNSWLESASVTGGLSYVGDDGFIGVALHQFDSRYGVPGGHGHDEDEGAIAAEDEPPVSIDLAQTRLDLNAVKELDGFFERLQLFAGFADYKHTELEGDEIGTIFANQGWEARFEAIQTEKDNWRAAYGLQIRDRDFSAIGDEAFVPPTKTQQIGVYTFQEKDLGELHLEGAARIERTEQTNNLSNGSQNYNLYSVSLGSDYHFSEQIRFGGTIFRTERAPTSEELFSNGPHLATNAFELGNADLKKEISKGAEFAYRHRKDTHFFTANIFYTDYDNYIFERPTGTIIDGLDGFEFVGTDAVFKGAELQGGADIGYLGEVFLSLDALAEYVRATTKSGNLPRIPPLSLLIGGEAKWQDLKLRAELDYAAKQTKTADIELPTDDYALVNMFATWTFQSDRAVKLKASVLNLLNEDARQHTSFLKDVVPLPGRNFRLSLSAEF